jgi:hypothetical protein
MVTDRVTALGDGSDTIFLQVKANRVADGDG